MKRIQRALSAALLLGLALAGALHAADQGRLLGTVVDANGKPVSDVKVTILSPGTGYKQEKTTDQNGKFTIVVVDAARDYVFRFEKQGFRGLEQPVKIPVGDLKRETFTLPPAQQAQPQEAPPTPEEEAAAKELEIKGQAANTYNEGVKLIQAGDAAAALPKFQEAASLDPKLPDPQYVLASIYLDQGKHAEALAAVDRYLELDPGKARGLRLRYDILSAKGDKAAAAKALDALVAAEPGRESAVRIYNLAAESLKAERNDEAVTYLKRAIEVDPTLDRAYVALGNHYLRKKSYKEAAEVVGRLLQSQPDNAEALTIRYEALKAAGDKAGAKAAQEAMKAASANQSPEATFKQGLAMFNAGNTADAKKAFESVLAADPNFSKAHYLLGITYANGGDVANAKKHFQTFLKMAPNDPDAKSAKEMLASLD